jgi:hypothetical protein
MARNVDRAVVELMDTCDQRIISGETKCADWTRDSEGKCISVMTENVRGDWKETIWKHGDGEDEDEEDRDAACMSCEVKKRVCVVMRGGIPTLLPLYASKRDDDENDETKYKDLKYYRI